MKIKLLTLVCLLTLSVTSTAVPAYLASENKNQVESGDIILNELLQVAEHITTNQGRTVKLLSGRQTILSNNQQNMVANQVKIMELLHKILIKLEEGDKK